MLTLRPDRRWLLVRAGLAALALAALLIARVPVTLIAGSAVALLAGLLWEVIFCDLRTTIHVVYKHNDATLRLTTTDRLVITKVARVRWLRPVGVFLKTEPVRGFPSRFFVLRSRCGGDDLRQLRLWFLSHSGG